MLSILFALTGSMPPKVESYMIIIGPAVALISGLALPFCFRKAGSAPHQRRAVFGIGLRGIFVLSLFLLGENPVVAKV